MFTGLVEATGTVAAVEPDGGGARLAVSTPLAAQLADGDSVAVNGVCLTARAVQSDRFSADVMAETLRRSSLAPLATGDGVNLELPLRADGPETLERTTLGSLVPGRTVNLEVDVIAKYVEKLMTRTVEAP
jgi:riboflavin synthase alpha subunit